MVGDPQREQNADSGSVYASDQTFEVSLPDGYYDVTLTIGDPGTSSPQGDIVVSLQGAQVGTVS
jgi:hypothetical protein